MLQYQISQKMRLQWKRLTAEIVAHVGFPAAAGQVEIQGHPQLLEGLQVLAVALAGELPQCILIPLSCLLHLPFLEDGEREERDGGK